MAYIFRGTMALLFTVRVLAESGSCNDDSFGKHQEPASFVTDEEQDSMIPVDVSLLQLDIEAHKLPVHEEIGLSVKSPIVENLTEAVGAWSFEEAIASIANASLIEANVSWNVVQLVRNEIEFEIQSAETVMPVKSKAVLAFLEAFVIPAFLGVDRCYMNQACLGIIKGITLGGLGLWVLIDYIGILINVLERRQSINALGFYAKFEPSEVETAFWITLIFLILKFVGVQIYRHAPTTPTTAGESSLSRMQTALMIWPGVGGPSTAFAVKRPAESASTD